MATHAGMGGEELLDIKLFSEAKIPVADSFMEMDEYVMWIS